MLGNKKPGTLWTSAPGNRKKNTMTKSQFNNTDKGALFKNRQKEPGSNAPDYAGPLDVGGTKYRLSAWLKDSAGGQKYMATAIKLDTAEQSGPKPKPSVARGSFDDEVPF
jgi:hypothetical protein